MTPYSTSSVILSSSVVVSPTPHPTSSLSVLPTPAPSPQSCSSVENSGTVYGLFDWPETAVGETAVHACPHGPEGGVAHRECGKGGRWGVVDGRECKNASETTQRLIIIAEVCLTLKTMHHSHVHTCSTPYTPLVITIPSMIWTSCGVFPVFCVVSAEVLCLYRP